MMPLLQLVMSIRHSHVQQLEANIRITGPKVGRKKPKRIDVHRIHKPNLRTMKQR